jgi:hypothetical protein
VEYYVMLAKSSPSCYSQMEFAADVPEAMRLGKLTGGLQRQTKKLQTLCYPGIRSGRAGLAPREYSKVSGNAGLFLAGVMTAAPEGYAALPCPASDFF